MKDCSTCKYGYEDEQFGFPMCHHPERFSRDCVDFNMHEEKEIEAEHRSSSEKPNNHEGLDELVNSYLQEHRHDVLLSPYNGLMEFAKLVCEWQKKPVKGLDDAAEEYLQNVKAHFLRTLEHPTAKDAFKAGAEWDREQYICVGRHAINEFAEPNENYIRKK